MLSYVYSVGDNGTNDVFTITANPLCFIYIILVCVHGTKISQYILIEIKIGSETSGF